MRGGDFQRAGSGVERFTNADDRVRPGVSRAGDDGIAIDIER